MGSDFIQVGGFMKVGEHNHIQQLYDNGNLFLNNFKFHQNNLSNTFRDPREGASKSIPLSSLKLFQNNQPLPFKFKSGIYHEFMPENLLNHIYCFYTIKENHFNKGYFVDEKLLKFGQRVLVIHDTQTFLQRAIEKLKSFPYNVKARFVNYYDDKILHENLSPFDKPNKYSYENEFRILVMGHSEPTLQIEIGSIKDISVILESKDLLKLSIKTLKDEK